MEKMEILMRIAYAGIGIVASGLPLAVTLIVAIKKRINAKKELEKAKANEILKQKANEFIEFAEKTYKEVNAILKSKNSTAGKVKKESVMTKLQAFAFDNKYEFDDEFWSKQIDEIVALTKKVNAK